MGDGGDAAGQAHSGSLPDSKKIPGRDLLIFSRVRAVAAAPCGVGSVVSFSNTWGSRWDKVSGHDPEGTQQAQGLTCKAERNAWVAMFAAVDRVEREKPLQEKFW